MSKSSEDLLLDFSLAGLIKIEGEEVETTEKLSKLLKKALFIVMEANKKYQLGLLEKEIVICTEALTILYAFGKPLHEDELIDYVKLLDVILTLTVEKRIEKGDLNGKKQRRNRRDI